MREASSIAAAAALMPLRACAAVSWSSRRCSSYDIRFTACCALDCVSFAINRGSSYATDGANPSSSRV